VWVEGKDFIMNVLTEEVLVVKAQDVIRNVVVGNTYVEAHQTTIGVVVRSFTINLNIFVKPIEK
jgi:hypothetical protein